VQSKLTSTQENGGIDLLFHTNTESGKTDDIASDPHINISQYNNSGEWASVSGRASIITDREVVKKYYSPALKAWVGDLGDGKHDGGPNDPRIGVIKVELVTATYALARGTQAGGLVELAKGVVTGSAPKVNRLREISESEVQTWRTSKAMVQ
jgi:general stress protein 26